MMVKSVTLPLAPEAAFELFTRRIGEWWPADRRHSQDPDSEIFLLESGRFFERARDGREVELGAVRRWDPPNLIVLDFFIATGPEKPTEVEIAFAPRGTGAELTVVHRPKPSSEALWTERAPRYARSWDVVLAALSQAAP
jgi:Activator of Hsp90 ATPase homolog 1-like protein